MIFYTDHYILTTGFYENSGDPLFGIPGQGQAVFDNLQKWIYLSAIFYLLIKLAIISLILHTALYLNDHEVAMYDIFKITVIAETVLFVHSMLKIVLFSYTFPNGNLLGWNKYSVGSLLELFPNVPADWYYVFQTFNIFEVFYWFFLAYGIRNVTDLNYDASLKIVVQSYVPALLIWISLVTFISLMISPATG
ncbi:hypothetical protein [Mucilaginibacter sp. UYCu711]|uniref:hypothetical protein n=1 Tax=Mucilaginibacter sp. UYCu711 TaxID=3156339 RepID=UPI003D263E64